MTPPDADVVVVRHGEIGVKSEQVRRKMESQLADNLRALLADRDVDGAVTVDRTRLYVETDEPGPATAVAADTFGVVSASPAVRVPARLDAIEDGLADLARTTIEPVSADAGSVPGIDFAVRARRAGEPEAHPFGSEDIGREGGSAIWATLEELGYEPAVDLESPEETFHVECRAETAYLYREKRDGPGGLPLGTQRPLVALLSGGIDSPVAAWSAMRRGAPVVPLYVDLGDHGGPDHRARAEATARDLARYAPNRLDELLVAPAGDVVADLVEAVGDTRMLSLRRFMVRLAAHVADHEGAVGVVTGESIGQKSSQTTANLRTTDAAVSLPVHRPNLTRDKTEITALARDIGTYEESTIPSGCNRVAPSFPETHADLAQVRDAEPEGLLDRAKTVAAAVERVPLTADDDQQSPGPRPE